MRDAEKFDGSALRYLKHFLEHTIDECAGEAKQEARTAMEALGVVWDRQDTQKEHIKVAVDTLKPFAEAMNAVDTRRKLLHEEGEWKPAHEEQLRAYPLVDHFQRARNFVAALLSPKAPTDEAAPSRSRYLVEHSLPIDRCRAIMWLPRDMTQEEARRVAQFAMELAGMDPQNSTPAQKRWDS
jgi:hypothetical protein